ncbi:ammonia-forming cytochrome c nitrite reductase [bacterium]|nr:ammonia-forming cytochrome c nitrite reductase [bacterium]
MNRSYVYLVVALLAIAFMTYMLLSIGSKKEEAVLLKATPVVKAEGVEAKNDVWGEHYHRQHDTWKLNKNSSEIEDLLDRYPQLAILWAGYGFSKDYNAPRGHAYALQSNRNTLRTGAPTDDKTGPMPMACWTCKSTDVARLIAEEGELEYFTGKWARGGSEIVNPIGCADCHDSQSSQLAISRPYLLRGWEDLGRSVDDITYQDMRSLACAQCHSEYYFKKTKYTDDQGDEKTAAVVTFPWANGLAAEDMEDYYDEREFKDWSNKLSKAPMLKAQHPGYEIFTTGVHFKRGLSCADCHMPYVQEGGVKYSTHHVQSPLNNIANSCLTCHRESEEEFRSIVAEKLARKNQLNVMAMNSLAVAHLTAKKAWEAGATEAQMEPILAKIRSAQWLWDYSIASHGSFFHAPGETLRLLGVANDKAMDARLDLVNLLANYGVVDYQVPDFSSKDKAQKLAGLDMPKLIEDKLNFKKTLMADWIDEATEEGRLTDDFLSTLEDHAAYLH